MQIEYQTEDLAQVGCDLLAYPIFEEDAANPSALEPLNKTTAGVVQSILSSGEFKPELLKCYT